MKTDKLSRFRAMKKYLIIATIVLAFLAVLGIQQKRIERLSNERDRYKGNSEALMTDVEYFKVRDSLSAARVEALELTMKEYERFRAQDASLIESLKKRNQDLAQVNTTQSETIIKLMSVPRDTLIIRDSVYVRARVVHSGDAWYDFDGLITENDFVGELHNRDSLILAETIKYHRFLGFLWKTKRIDERQENVVSRNPHTQILNIEHIVLEK